jgi:prepilin peptidase CpaA
MTVNQFTNEFLIIFLGIILLVASIIDLRSQKIPNVITFPATGLALAYHSFVNGFNGFLFSVAGLAAGVGLLFIPYLLGGMGAGDAKLLGVVGGVLGAKGVFYAFLSSAIVGGIYAVILTLIYRQLFRGFYKKQITSLMNFLLTRKYIPDPEESDPKKPRLCYGLAIAIGTGIYIVFDLSGYGFLS